MNARVHPSPIFSVWGKAQLGTVQPGHPTGEGDAFRRHKATGIRKDIFVHARTRGKGGPPHNRLRSPECCRAGEDGRLRTLAFGDDTAGWVGEVHTVPKSGGCKTWVVLFRESDAIQTSLGTPPDRSALNQDEISKQRR